MKEVKKPSVIPVYGVAAFFIIYALIFPLSRLLHYVILAAAAVLIYFILQRIFPGTTEYVEIPKEPETTGDPETDALMKEALRAETEFKRLRESIQAASVRAKIDELADITAKIFADLKDDPDDLPQIKRFAEYYLPTTLKLLNAYDRMCLQDISGQNISDSKKRIEETLDRTVAAYKNLFDALFENQAFDIETDITVLENMMKKNGLSGSDFDLN